MINQLQDAIVTVVATIGFWVIFWLSWLISLRFGSKVFITYTEKDKAEWCTRICSTVHAGIVIPGVVACLLDNDWSVEDIAFSSPTLCRVIFDISIAYFIYDFIALIYWRLNHWQGFVAHHIIGALPYIINNFVPGCYCGNYVLAFFLLVEIPTLPLNCVGVMDQIGMRDSTYRFVAFSLMYVLWFLARIILPIYLLVVLYEIILPTWYSEREVDDFIICTIPSTISANLISFLCFYIFLSQLSIDMFKECIQPHDVDEEKDATRSPDSPIGMIRSPGDDGSSPAIVRAFSTYGAMTGDKGFEESNEETSEDEVFGIRQMFKKKSQGSQQEDSSFRHSRQVLLSDEHSDEEELA